MRIAALYDIHGNYPALEAVLSEIREANVDRVVIGGDVVPGPMPREAISRLTNLDIPTQFIHGNGDREVLALMRGMETGAVPEPFRESMRWVAKQLGAEAEKLLASWPPTLTIDVEGIGNVLFCHATPRNDTDIFTRLTPEDQLLPIFQTPDVALFVCGHTHMQFERTIGSVRIVNAGSVGMPFGEPGAYWLLIGPEVQLRRTDYDLSNAAERIRVTEYPQAGQFAEQNILHPPSEEAMIAAFSKVRLS